MIGVTRIALHLFLLSALAVTAEPPAASFIFPAGGRVGTTVPVLVGGLNFHGEAGFEVLGNGIQSSPTVKEIKTIWIEGPMIPQPGSQRSEDYPKDHAGQIQIAANSPIGIRHWRCWTSQGAVPAMRFVVGDLPEIVEKEITGRPLPVAVQLPLTINGRIFPREDVDLWEFDAAAGEIISAVVASRQLGYPLDAVLAVSTKGNSIATTRTIYRGDPAISFKAPTTGTYQIKINDASFGGLQHYVYRLTIRKGSAALAAYPAGGPINAVLSTEIIGHSGKIGKLTLPISDSHDHFLPIVIDGQNLGALPFQTSHAAERSESEPNDKPTTHGVVETDTILNGRIDTAGDTDTWSVKLTEKVPVHFEVFASRLYSPLDTVLKLLDAEGNVLLQNDDLAAGQPDSMISYTPTKSGIYHVSVQDRFASRGGPSFVYRLKVQLNQEPDFRLTFLSDAVNITRKTDSQETRPQPKKDPGIQIQVERRGDFKGEIKLAITGLPDGVTIANANIPAQAKTLELAFTAPPKTKIQSSKLTIVGVAEINGKSVVRIAQTQPAFGEPAIENVRYAISPIVPFKHVGQFQQLNNHPSGSQLPKHYRIDRGGFSGPITVQLADRQGRHLQGVSGPVLALPPEATEFTYPIIFPPRMENGRTSRSQIILIGELTDFDGSRHRISYTSNEQDDQSIAVMTAGLITVTPLQENSLVTPNSTLTLRVRVRCAPSLANRPIRLELITADHVQHVKSVPVLLASGQEWAELKINLGADPGPFNAPLLIRASTADKDLPYIGEADIEMVR